MLEVYTWEPNANSGKPLLCLHEKQVPFTHHYIDMGKLEQFSPAFLAINPDGTIPAVVHDGFVMTESTPAMEYIDDAFAGPSLRPADPSPSAEDIVVADASLAAAWRRLRPAEREVLALALVEELAPAELAVALGVSVNAATIRVHRAKKRLHELLERTAGPAT